MAAPKFVYQEPFPHGKDDTAYRLLSQAGVSTSTCEGREILKNAGIPEHKLISKPTMLEAARTAVAIAIADGDEDHATDTDTDERIASQPARSFSTSETKEIQ